VVAFSLPTRIPFGVRHQRPGPSRRGFHPRLARAVSRSVPAKLHRSRRVVKPKKGATPEKKAPRAEMIVVSAGAAIALQTAARSPTWPVAALPSPWARRSPNRRAPFVRLKKPAFINSVKDVTYSGNAPRRVLFIPKLGRVWGQRNAPSFHSAPPAYSHPHERAFARGNLRSRRAFFPDRSEISRRFKQARRFPSAPP